MKRDRQLELLSRFASLAIVALAAAAWIALAVTAPRMESNSVLGLPEAAQPEDGLESRITFPQPRLSTQHVRSEAAPRIAVTHSDSAGASQTITLDVAGDYHVSAVAGSAMDAIGQQSASAVRERSDSDFASIALSTGR